MSAKGARVQRNPNPPPAGSVNARALNYRGLSLLNLI